MIFDFLKRTDTPQSIRFIIPPTIDKGIHQMQLSLNEDDQLLYQKNIFGGAIDREKLFNEEFFKRIKHKFGATLFKELEKSQKIDVICDFKKIDVYSVHKLFFGDLEHLRECMDNLGYRIEDHLGDRIEDQLPLKFIMANMSKNIMISTLTPFIGSYSLEFEKDPYYKRTRINVFFTLDCNTFSIYKIIKNKYFHIFT